MGQAVRQLRAVPTGAREEVAADEGWQRARETGDRAMLLPATIRAIVAEAGRDGRLANEIGALRVVTERLLAEVSDAARLAILLPPLINAIVRAMQAQRALGGEEDDELAQLVMRMLTITNSEQETADLGE